MKKALFALMTVSMLAMMTSAYAQPTEKPFENDVYKRIAAEADVIRQTAGDTYNEDGQVDKKGFDTRTDREVAQISDRIMQEEGRKYNETK